MIEQLIVFFRDSDCQKKIWCIALAIGIVLLIYGIIYWVTKKNRQEIHYVKAAVIEFFACWIMYIPAEYYNELENNKHLVMRGIESVTTALLRSLVVYQGSGYEKVAYNDHMFFSSVYSTVRVGANIILLLLVGGLIVRFMNGPMQKLKLFCFRRRYTYIFTEFNEKTFSLAKSIAHNMKLRGKKNILFILKNYNDNSIIEKIDSIGGLYIYGDLISTIHALEEKTMGIEIFLFSISEEENLLELEKICEKYNNKCKIKVFVELIKTPWNLYNDFLKRYNINADAPLIVNFIRTEENFVYNLLLEHSIFENAIERQVYKEIKILLIGEMHERNLEMLKAVLQLGQMPGYRVSVIVVESSADRKVLHQKMPEIHDDVLEEGNAIYSLKFMENIPYDSDIFNEIIEKEAFDFSFAFINVGSDLQNLNLAIRLNAFCLRKFRNADRYKILVNVNSKKVSNDWNKSILKRLILVGDIEQTYEYTYITMSKVEKASIAIHDQRQENRKIEAEKSGNEYTIVSWLQYCNNEYNRHSVYARTLSSKYKVWVLKQKLTDNRLNLYDMCKVLEETILDEKGNETNVWKIYEHMRWNVYTRTNGYVLSDNSLLEKDNLNKEIRDVAFVHNDLVPFIRLDKREQQKDNLNFTKEIIDILEKL